MKTMIILRGLPGSGKTTFADKIAQLAIQSGPTFVAEADDYFVSEEGYKFDSNKINSAHEWCQYQVKTFMENNDGKHDDCTVIVSNTSTKEWEMYPYKSLAEKYGYQIHYLIVENRHQGKSVHNVPESTIGKMKSRFDICL